MRSIANVRLDKSRPALILTKESKRHLLAWVTVAPITSTIRGITSEVSVGQRNGLDQDCVISCDNITTVRVEAVGETIGLLFDDQELELARAISDAFGLRIQERHPRWTLPSTSVAKARRTQPPSIAEASGQPRKSLIHALCDQPAGEEPGPVATVQSFRTPAATCAL